MHGLGWISSGRKTTAPVWLAWVIMRCIYVGEWYSRRGHFVPVNELMSIFDQQWETRKHFHDLKKYPQCRLHWMKSNLQFRSPAWRYGCVRPWIRNQFLENPTPMWWVIHMCRGFDPLFSLWQDRARSFGGIFLIHQQQSYLLGYKNYQFLQKSIFLAPNSIFSSIFLGPIFSGQRHTPISFQAEYPPQS